MKSRATLTISLFCLAASPPQFGHLAVHGSALRSTHAIPLEVRGPSGYRLLRPTSRRATFNGHPYEVTLAALAGKTGAIMVHAEKVADHSGASNYDKLPSSPWAGFRIRSQCASIGAKDIAEEHDLKWLADRGWSPVGSVVLEQHLKSTADHNQEIVISLLVKVPSCAHKGAAAKALGKLRRQVTVRPV